MNDSQSQIRGLGRYVQALQSVLTETPSIETPYTFSSRKTYIDPFFNLIGKPRLERELFSGDQKIAVVHDVIPLKHLSFPWVGLKGKLWNMINQLLLQRFDIIVTDSGSSKQDIVRILNIAEKRVRVVYPYSPLQDIAHASVPSVLPHKLKAQEYVVYVGDVNWHKNIIIMAKAALRAKVKLVCVGGAFVKQTSDHAWLGDLREFLALSEQHPDLIILTGFVDDMILAALLQNALANILVSFDEGFGYSYIEAGHFHTPSILTDGPVFHEISADAGAVFVDPRDPIGIADAIVTLQKDQAKRKNLGDAAYAQSIRYSKVNFRTQWVEVLAK